MTKLTFLGVRGSYPVVSKEFLKYGGNTSCILIEDQTDIVFLDAGTGIIKCGDYIIKKTDINILHIFLSHLHLDHIQGLPYFAPLFHERFTINVYIPDDKQKKSKSFLLKFFNPPIHPVKTSGLKATVNFFELPERQKKKIDINKNISIQYVKDFSHPNKGVLIYKVSIFDKNIIYATDIDVKDGLNKEVVQLCKDCDILIHDAQYSEEYLDESDPYVNNGHSSVTMALLSTGQLNAKQLYLFHYGPTYNDDILDKISNRLKRKGENYSLSQEGLKINLRR